MKSILYYHDTHKNYWRLSADDRRPVQVLFLQTISSGDYNRTTYSQKKQESTKTESRTQLYFLPRPDADKKAIERELHRGKIFFSYKEGFLFGALYELGKLGEFIKIEV